MRQNILNTLKNVYFFSRILPYPLALKRMNFSCIYFDCIWSICIKKACAYKQAFTVFCQTLRNFILLENPVLQIVSGTKAE